MICLYAYNLIEDFSVNRRITMEFLEFYNKYNYLFSLGVTLLMAVFGFFANKYMMYIKKMKQKKLLGMNNNPIEVVAPVRHGELNSFESDYITIHEAELLFELSQSLVLADRFESPKIIASDAIGKMKSSNNRFCYGSYKPNLYVRHLFRKFLPSVKFGVSEEYYHNPEKADFVDLLCVDDTIGSHFIKYGDNKFFKYSAGEDYIMLVRLTGKDCFGDINRGVTHICFGGISSSTLLSARCFNEHQDTVYKMLKHHKGNYAVIIRCSEDGDIDFKSFVDITNDVF